MRTNCSERSADVKFERVSTTRFEVTNVKITASSKHQNRVMHTAIHGTPGFNTPELTLFTILNGTKIRSWKKTQKPSSSNFVIPRRAASSEKMNLNNPDERTIKRYTDCILESSEKNMRFGTIDVTQFCDEFGV